MTDGMRVALGILIMGASLVGCGDVGADLDAGTCDGSPQLACPCDPIGEVICRSPGPDLYCASGTWIASADGPCPGLDAGPGTTDGSTTDAGTGRDADTIADAAASDGGTDAATSPDAAIADAATTDAGTAADAGSDAGPPAMATYCIDIDVANTCDMTVTPTEITIPAGQTAYFCWRNRSSDYAVDVWLSYGGGYTDLEPGATWNEPVGHCLGPAAHTEYADIQTACSEHRFLIRCL